jgi:signal transduction protein with GAF and PtsI domain
MYNQLKDKFTIKNNIDYLNTQEEKSKIDNFLLDIDTLNYPYLTETLEQLEELSERLFRVLKEYDTKRLNKLK